MVQRPMHAFVLMTALPPTKGHLQLLRFSAALAVRTTVLVCTQPGEPFVPQRAAALKAAAPIGVTVYHYHKTIEQNPEHPEFHAMWRKILAEYGFQPGDIIVASEHWGKRFCDEVGAVFYPFDIDREIYPCKATNVRNHSRMQFEHILPQFQPELIQTVTFIGAESTGKTTLSKTIAKIQNGHWLMEWARPYLEENKVAEITYEAMHAIWQGQEALQYYGRGLRDKPWIIQDTDLFATVGYWDFWKGDTPKGLVQDASLRKSDLYIIPQSNIPFEEDPIRYGNGERESKDEFWFALMEKHGLNYRVLTASNFTDRVIETEQIMQEHWEQKVGNYLRYERTFNG